MPSNLTHYNIFIGSPGGLEKERRSFRKTVEEYNATEAISRGFMFNPVGWEDTLPGIGRSQSLINEDLKKCDYVVIMLHDRWGSHPGENEYNATSGTQEEYNLALECIEDKDHQMQQILMLFKSVPMRQLSDPGEELKKVVDFKKKIEAKKTLLYKNFYSVREFEDIIRKQLAKWLINADSSLKGVGTEKVASITSLDNDSGFENFMPNDENANKGTEIGSKAKEMIDYAWELAKEGHLVQAEVEFSKATVNQPGAFQLLNYANFLSRILRFDQALSMIDKALELSRDSNDLQNEASALDQRGHILRVRGDITGAEEMFNKTLEIYKKLGSRENLAANYLYLGNIYLISDKIPEAEEMFTNALGINKELGRRIGLAANYGNLGSIHLTRNELPEAEEMFMEALKINEELGRRDGMAINYGNLGVIHLRNGNLPGAEEMFKKSIKINKELGLLENLAINYKNMASILLRRRDWDGAVKVLLKSEEIDKKLGRL